MKKQSRKGWERETRFGFHCIPKYEEGMLVCCYNTHATWRKGREGAVKGWLCEKHFSELIYSAFEEHVREIYEKRK